MISLYEIDLRIDLLLDHLSEIQNEDGGFDRMRIQPNSPMPDQWSLHWKSTSYDTAVPLVPLTFMSSEKSRRIVRKGVACLKQNSLDSFLWTWPGPHPVPFGTDDTSICSYVLSRSGEPVRNKEFLNEWIDGDNYYRFFIWPKKISRNIPFKTYLKLRWKNRKIVNSQHLSLDELKLSDSEFTSTCVNLLYLGRTASNEQVWENVIRQFNERKIDNYLYYMNLFHAVYCYARLLGYGSWSELIETDGIAESYFSDLYKDLNTPSTSAKSVLLMNSILFFSSDLEPHNDLVARCMNEIDSKVFSYPTSYYSSRKPVEIDSKDHRFYTCYGSAAITCSLYLEFLNLLRKRVYGSYYIDEE